MHGKLLAGALIASFALNAPAARAGLIENVFHNISPTAYTPTDASISATQANASIVSPSYSFINSAATFNYTGASTQTNIFLGSDAAGAALSDASSTGYSAFDAQGFINIVTAGTYTFNISAADDAARVYLAGALIAERNFPGSGLAVPSSYIHNLAIGSYAFDLFYYQQTGGSNLSFLVSGAAPVTYSVAEPSTLGLLVAAGMVLAGMTFRQRSRV